VSVLVGAARPTTITTRKDDRYDLFPFRINLDYAGWPDSNGVRTFQNAWWPGNGGLVGAGGADCGPDDAAIWWTLPNLTSGATARYGIAGVTRDPYGTRLGSVTVKMFRTADDSLQDSVTSDVEGNYTVSSPYTDAHYLYIYKAGPPEMFGGSANTLLPT